jgi:hypothetical protein
LHDVYVHLISIERGAEIRGRRGRSLIDSALIRLCGLCNEACARSNIDGLIARDIDRLWFEWRSKRIWVEWVIIGKRQG